MKKIFFWVMLFLFIVLPFAIAEIVCNFISPKASIFQENPLMMVYPIEDGFDENVTREMNFNNNPNRTVRYIPDPKRWYRLESEARIPKNKKMILNFGDSSTFGWGLSNRQNAYPGKLNEFLPHSIASINLGVPGYSSLQGLKYLEELIPLYHNHIVAVTLYFGNNDCVENGLPDISQITKANSMSTVSAVSTWLNRYSAFYRVMRKIVWKLRRNDNSQPRVSPQEYHANLQKMIDICNEYNIKVVLIQPPVNLTWRPGHLTYSRSLESDLGNAWVSAELQKAKAFHDQGLNLLYVSDDSCYALLNQSIEHDWIMPRIKKDWLAQLTNTASVPLIKIHPPFLGAEYPYCFEDYCHPSTKIHFKIAQEIAQTLGYKTE